MKKIYLLFILACFLSASSNTLAQCSVNISTNPNNTQLNCNIASIQLTADTTGTKGLVTFTWSNGANTRSINVSAAANYTVTIKDTSGCSSSSSINITRNIIAPVVKILPFPDTICSGGSATLVALGAVTYSWLPGLQTANPITVNPANTTTYTVTGTAANGCTGKDSFKLVVNPLPTAAIGGSATVCQNSAQPAVTFTGFSGKKPFTFTYDINGGTKQIITTSGNNTSVTVNAPTEILGVFNYNLVSITDSNGCTLSQSGTARITINEGPVLTSFKTTSVCSNNSLTYTATSSVTETNFDWQRLPVPGISNPAVSENSASITETLLNTTDTAVVINYIFTLTAGSGASCISRDTLKVTVNPTPVIDPIPNKSYCNSKFVSGGIPFTSKSPNTVFSWTNSNTAIGLPSSGSGSILPFIAKNTTANPITATIAVKVKASADSCIGDSIQFAITVLPAPVLTSAKTASVCDSMAFSYIAKSSATNTNFNWSRDAVNGISNLAKSGSSAAVADTLDNITDTAVMVKYFFSLSTDTGCIIKDSVMVTVNPTPVIDSINPNSYCNREFVSGGIPFTSKSPNAVFAWTNSDTAIGLPFSGSGSILPFIATNTTVNPITATITVFVKASADSCIGANRTFTITVLPSPVLTSAKTASVCDSTVFNYMATSYANNTAFQWSRAVVNGISNPIGSGTTGTIMDNLNNTTPQPVDVYYVFTLSAGFGCVNKDSVRVTVSPTPLIDPISDRLYCNNSLIQPVIFTSLTNNAMFTWDANPSIGFGTSGAGNIPAFITSNQSDSSLKANVKVSISSGNNCAGDPVTFAMTVYPTATLKSTKDTSVCDNAPFIYQGKSSITATSFKWVRANVTGINNSTDSSDAGNINEQLDNLVAQPVGVNYIFKLTVGPGCVTNDSVKVTVNPTPLVNHINPPPPFCNGITVQPISFSSNSPNAAFTWSSDTTIGFGLTGSDSIPSFIASNAGTTAINATITVKITASTDRCPGPDSSFRIIVNPSPQKPFFTSLSRYPDNEVLTVCSGTENINFNVNSPDAGISYLWTATPANSPLAIIKNTSEPNTAISFRNTGLDRISINLLSTDRLTCTNSVSQIVQIGPANGIDERKIFLKQPGNLLIYPDNSLDALNGYQWGYDSLLQVTPAVAYGVPIPITGQVYQAFIPDSRFIQNNQLDTVNRAFWVSLQQGSCYSRVYYNGPFARLRNAVTAPTDNTVQLKVIPNPSSGNFEIHLQGNIYGSISAKIYNSLGQVVLEKVFTKNNAEINQKINALHFANGLYFLVINSSDLKKVVSRIIIQH